MLVRRASAFTGIKFPPMGPPLGTEINCLATKWRVSSVCVPSGRITWVTMDGRTAVTPMSFFSVAAFQNAHKGPPSNPDPIPPPAKVEPTQHVVGDVVPDATTVAGWECKIIARNDGKAVYARWTAARGMGTLEFRGQQVQRPDKVVWRHTKMTESPLDRPETEVPDGESWEGEPAMYVSGEAATVMRGGWCLTGEPRGASVRWEAYHTEDEAPHVFMTHRAVKIAALLERAADVRLKAREKAMEKAQAVAERGSAARDDALWAEYSGMLHEFSEGDTPTWGAFVTRKRTGRWPWEK